jgi:hypothetical protein
MRALRGAAAMVLVGLVLVIPVAAKADGGAFISFAKTHYLPGEVAEGEGYVYVPKQHQDLLDRGPFYGYLANAGTGKQDLQVGTVELEPYGKTEFELHLSFTVPDVPGDYYTVRICNVPCTVSGFREPLTGTISIVQTVREGTLLTENTKLSYRNYALQRKVRKGERAVEDLEAELAAASVPAPPVATPTPAFAPARTVTERDDRPLVDAWAVFGLGGALLVALACVAIAFAFSRGSRMRDALPVK